MTAILAVTVSLLSWAMAGGAATTPQSGNDGQGGSGGIAGGTLDFGLVSPSGTPIPDPSVIGGRVVLPNGAQGVTSGTDINLAGRNEPTLAVNANDTDNIAYASLRAIRVSTDGGNTFAPEVLFTVPPTHNVAGDPTLAFDANGRLFLAHLGTFAGGIDIFFNQCDPTTGAFLAGYPKNLSVLAGEPGGSEHSHDKIWMAIDTNSGSPYLNRIYMVWTDFALFLTSFGVKVSYSDDQGASWTFPVVISTVSIDPNLDEGFTWPAHIAVAPNNDVYVAYHAQPGIGFDPVTLAPNGVSGRVYVVRSTDGGDTWAQKTQAFTAGFSDMTFNVQRSLTFPTSSTVPGLEDWLQGSVQPWVLPDPLVPGRIHVVANDDPDNDTTTDGNDSSQGGDAANVYIATSDDFGQTWNSPIPVDDGPAGTFQVLPTASIDPQTGWIAVHYYDNRSGNTNAGGLFLLDTMLQLSTDGGQTFSPAVAINDVQFDPKAGAPINTNLGTPSTFRMGEYNGIVAIDCSVHSVWCGNTFDTSIPPAAIGQQSVYESRIPSEFVDVPPFIACPQSVTLQCDVFNAGVVPGPATASDSCDQAVPIISSQDATDPGDCADSFVVTRTWTAMDSGNNPSTCDQTITVVDTTNPEPTCPATEITIECNVAVPAFNPSFDDNCDASVGTQFQQNQTPGTCPQERTITRTTTGTDNCGNSAQCSQTVNVQDTGDPTISCPAGTTISCEDSRNPSNTGSATATDLCDNSVIPTHSDQNSLSGCSGTGTITRTWTATDDCGNSDTCQQTITVMDQTDPQITCPGPATIQCNSSTNPNQTGGSATATDNCDLSITPTFSDTPNLGGCNGTGTITRTWRAVDDCGNDSTCNQTITVVDTQGPTITCPTNRTVQCGQSTLPAATGTATATDTCGTPTVGSSDSVDSAGCGSTSVITRTWTATDACGNPSSCQQTITVIDTTRPTINCPNDVVVTCALEAGVPVGDVLLEATANDNCDTPTISDNRPAGFYPPSCSSEGGTVVTFTALDSCGNIQTCDVIVSVIGDECCPGRVELDTDLTLLPMRLNLKQDSPGPVKTKAIFDIWNSNEIRFSGTHRCVSCWDQTLLSLYGEIANPQSADNPNHFLLDILQTDKGKARIDAEGSDVCQGSSNVPLLGLSIKEMKLNGSPTPNMRAASPLPGQGNENGRIQYDIIDAPEESSQAGLGSADVTGQAVETNPTDPGQVITAGLEIEERATISAKGSLLVWTKVELKWNAQGVLIQDTFLTLMNDSANQVKVQLYLVNGDGSLPPVFHQGQIIERGHPGWNWADVQLTLTGDESTYWAVSSGLPKGVSPFTVLDPGNPQGRPDLDPLNPGGRILRGFVVGWAVNDAGKEVRWNHLTGDGTIVNFRDTTAADYEATAFRCLAGVEDGQEPDGQPGELKLNGQEYSSAPDKLLFDFYASPTEALSHPDFRP